MTHQPRLPPIRVLARKNCDEIVVFRSHDVFPGTNALAFSAMDRLLDELRSILYVLRTSSQSCTVLSTLRSLNFILAPVCACVLSIVKFWRNAYSFFSIECCSVGHKTAMCVCSVLAQMSDKMGESEINRTFEVIWINWFCKWTRLKTYFDFAFISSTKLNFTAYTRAMAYRCCCCHRSYSRIRINFVWVLGLHTHCMQWTL